MPSMNGPLASAIIEIDRIDDNYAYFKIPDLIRVDKKKCVLEKKYLTGKRRDQWLEMPVYVVSKAGTARITINKRTYSVARLIYLAFHPEEIENIDPVMYKDGNKMNLHIDNLYIGRAGEAKSRKFGTYDPMWYSILDKLIPDRKQRNCRNPVYMKLINMRKGPDGLNHSERYFKKLRETKLKTLD